MKLTRKRMTTAIGMAVGVTLLTGAAFASYNTSNGYEIGKTAVKGLMQNENYTAEFKMALLLDGENISSTTIKELYDRNGDVVLNKSEKYETPEQYRYYMGSDQCEIYVQDDDKINVYHLYDGNVESSVHEGYAEYYRNGTFDMLGVNNNDEDKKVQGKIIRFAELVADTFVGDLKNNIVYVSGDDASSTYELSLDTMQIPEVVNAGLSAMFSTLEVSNQGFDDEYKDPFLQFGTDPIIKNVSLKFTVDSEGRLTDGEASVTLSGNGHEGAAELSLKMYDYGTTKPQRIDVSTLKNVETYHADRENTEVYTDGDDMTKIVTDKDVKEAAEKGYFVTEDGDVMNSDHEVVGNVVINGDGEGVIVYNEN